MKRIAGWLKGLLGLGALAALTMLLIALFSQATNPAQTPAQGGESVSPIETPLPRVTDVPGTIRAIPRTPTPTRPGYIPVYTGTPPTSTPRPGETSPPDKSTPTPTPTPTPMPVTDLAEGFPDEDKVVYIVRRSGGTYEKYLLPVGRWEDRKQLMEMGPGDVIVRSNPLVPLPPSTPEIARSVTATPTDTSFASPLPAPSQVSQP